jgi:LytR cell envelope-related transcriptional attenuator
MERGPLIDNFPTSTSDASKPRRTPRVGRYVAAVLALALVGGLVVETPTVYHWAAASMRDEPRFRGGDVRAPEGTRVRVELFNATQHRGLGRRAMLYLRDQGFDVVTLGTSTALRDTTLVVGRGTHVDWARLVSRALGVARVEARADSSRDVDVSVYLGSTWRPPPHPFYP